MKAGLFISVIALSLNCWLVLFCNSGNLPIVLARLNSRKCITDFKLLYRLGFWPVTSCKRSEGDMEMRTEAHMQWNLGYIFRCLKPHVSSTDGLLAASGLKSDPSHLTLTPTAERRRWIALQDCLSLSGDEPWVPSLRFRQTARRYRHPVDESYPV